ncbi:toxin-antitoxin system TumE family protein [Nostoc flagelliforme]|uniref:toxin-antitoxin system TumE family protein n=1 Tax=Nostoc flagelliforme TaxID=1306274 RepID=UPI0021F1FCFC|nr:DUF6516 family protein [Nostoc flagelliforme]
MLHLREFVYVEISPDRKMYSYQYMNSENNLIFRYDNTEHHRKLNLTTFPHHTPLLSLSENFCHF